jgi:hypothetical protein
MRSNSSGRRYLDALVQLFLKQSKYKALFHIEVEGKGKPAFLMNACLNTIGRRRQPIITLDFEF